MDKKRETSVETEPETKSKAETPFFFKGMILKMKNPSKQGHLLTQSRKGSVSLGADQEELLQQEREVKEGENVPRLHNPEEGELSLWRFRKAGTKSEDVWRPQRIP